MPHVYGKTDADAVFGVIYAQAEDDFNRVETNFMNSMGRLAEAEGEAEIWRDLRMKLFIDPDDLKAKYQTSPDWLKKLMDAWADGLNYYLHTHPQTKPRVIQKFEPWMALSFSEGSIGGDIERVSLSQLEAFYGGAAKQQVAELEIPAVTMPPEPTGSNGFAVGPSRTASGKAMLWINPHTSFFFREEAQMVSEEGLNAYGAITWGQFFIYQGFNERAGWMHTSSGADNIDEYLETVVKKDNGVFYRYGTEERAMTMKRIVVPYKTATGMARARVHGLSHAPRAGGPRGGRQVGVGAADGRAGEGAHPVVLAHQGEEPGRLPRDDGPAHELVEQHGVRRRRRQHRLLPRELRSQEGSEDRLDQAGRRQHPGHRVAGRALRGREPEHVQPAERLDSEHQQLAVLGVGPQQPEGEGLPVVHGSQRREPARRARGAGARERQGADQGHPARRRVRPRAAGVRAPDPGAGESLRSAAGGPRDEGAAEGSGRAAQNVGLQVERRLGRQHAGHLLGRRVVAPLHARGSEGRRLGVRFHAQQGHAGSAPRGAGGRVDQLAADFGKWDTPWGEVNRFQRLTGDIVQPFDDNGASIPVPFTSARWGSLASFGARAYKGTKKWYGTSGNSFVAAVEFGDTVSAKAVTAGGLNADPKSKHFNDQAERYATGNLRDVYFYRDQLKGHTEREYKPGQ